MLCALLKINLVPFLKLNLPLMLGNASISRANTMIASVEQMI